MSYEYVELTAEEQGIFSKLKKKVGGALDKYVDMGQDKLDDLVDKSQDKLAKQLQQFVGADSVAKLNTLIDKNQSLVNNKVDALTEEPAEDEPAAASQIQSRSVIRQRLGRY
jgi:hypothetical protein